MKTIKLLILSTMCLILSSCETLSVSGSIKDEKSGAEVGASGGRYYAQAPIDNGGVKGYARVDWAK